MSVSAGTVAVLGGGISGLVAAYRLTQVHPAPKRVVLFEASSRLGGWIHSVRNEDGVVYETGPRTMRPVGEAAMSTLNLLDELNLNDKVISLKKSHPAAKNRFIYMGGKMLRLPTDPGVLFKTHPPFQRPLVLAGLQDIFTRRSSEHDESIYEFINRRLGKDLAECIFDPLTRGICAGDCREISVRFLLKNLKDYELKYGSIILGALVDSFGSRKKPVKQLSDLARRSVEEGWSIWTIQNGLQTIPEALAERAARAGVEIFMESPCVNLKFNGDEGVVITSQNHELSASRVISALPGFQLARLVNQAHPDLAGLLSSIEAVTVGLVNMEWPGQRLGVNGFGALVPSSEPVPVLGMVFDSCSFPQGDRTIVTTMMGGRWFKSLFGDQVTKNKLIDVARQQASNMLGILDPPSRAQAHIQQDCIPQYVVGHTSKVDNIRRYINEHRLALDLIGASYDGVSVNDCIHNAMETVNRLATDKKI